MDMSERRKLGKFYVIVALLTLVSIIATLHITYYHERDYVHRQGPLKPWWNLKPQVLVTSALPKTSAVKMEPMLVSDFRPSKPLIIFPTHFEADNLGNAYSKSFGKPPRDAHMIRYALGKPGKATAVSSVVQSSEFSPHKLGLFNSFHNIDGNMDKCDQIQTQIRIDSTQPKTLDASLKSILTQFRAEKSAYYKDLMPYIGADLDKHLAEDTVDEYWFRLAGTSVWLEQYGVHYLISRVLYSKEKARNRPFVSLIFVQIYNEHWQELKDVQLILPTVLPTNGHVDSMEDKIRYRAMQFPSFLPVAHHINDKHKYYGPEDPRIMLVQNQLGFEEPLIVFNAYHRKAEFVDSGNEGELSVKFHHFRAMFVCWPWQFQLGKKNVDGISNELYDYTFYSRVHELIIEGQDRIQTQKNWTPFFAQLHGSNAYHSEILFVYKWHHFEVLKCPLVDITYDAPLVCRFEYKMNTQGNVGALRGGTELINIRQLAQDTLELGVAAVEELEAGIPKDREIWIGVARAHIENCGCGKVMYRPNLVIVTKDYDVFKVHTVSSFFSLGIEVLGWDLAKPHDYCIDDEPSVFIPNGISSWYIQESAGAGDFEDIMTMSFSISDHTCQIVHIKGLLRSLFELDNISRDKLFAKPTMKKAEFEQIGFNNDNVDCAVTESKLFCHEFGQANAQRPEKNDPRDVANRNDFQR